MNTTNTFITVPEIREVLSVSESKALTEAVMNNSLRSLLRFAEGIFAT
ncbi:MAG: hypothetical protein K6E13_03540 [Lachnospiraceae bacterium]|nr:hypothetical protein [Lachnospiraceae bacterium]